jgi:hypothetical protein
MTISKYIIVLALSAIPLASSADRQTKAVDKAYVLGFEDGTDAVTNAYNAEMCAQHYKKSDMPLGSECYGFYENFKLRVARYNKIKNNLAALEKESKNGKNSAGDKKSSDKRTPDPP